MPTQKNSASWDLQLGFNLAFKRLIGNQYTMCGLVCNMFIFIPFPPPPPPSSYVVFLDCPSPPPSPPLCIRVVRKSPVSAFFAQFFPLISCPFICPLLNFSGTRLNHPLNFSFNDLSVCFLCPIHMVMPSLLFLFSLS